MRYGQNLIDDYRRSATYVDKVLKGRKPRETRMSRLWVGSMAPPPQSADDTRDKLDGRRASSVR